MKNQVIILITLIFIACNGSIDNESIKSEIDKLPFTECNKFVEIDSNGNQIDIRSIEKLKFNKDGKKVFKYKEYEYNGQAFKNSMYLWNDGTDFLITTESSKDDFYSYSEVFRNRSNKIQKMIVIERFDKKSDTMNLTYKHTGNTTVIRSTKPSDQIETIFRYNDNNKVISETMIIENDTFSVSKYTYANGKIKSKETTKYNEQTLRIEYEYDEHNNLKTKSEIGINYKQDSIKNIMNYAYNTQNEMTSFSELNLIMNEMKYYKVIKSPCD